MLEILHIILVSILPRRKRQEKLTANLKMKIKIELAKRNIGWRLLYVCELSYLKALRKNLCKFKNCDKSDILERLKNNRSNFLQYTTDTVICQGSLDISLPEWSAAEWNQADIRRLSRACRGT